MRLGWIEGCRQIESAQLVSRVEQKCQTHSIPRACPSIVATASFKVTELAH